MIAMRRDHELHGRRRSRNWGVFAALIGLVVLLVAVTIVKLGPGAANPTGNDSWGQALVEWLRGDAERPVAEPAPGAEPTQ